MKRTSTSGRIFDTVNTLFMALVVFLMAYPFWYVVNYALSDPGKVRTGMIWLPSGFNLQSFQVCFNNPDILNGLFVSVARTILGSFVMIFITSMAAYVITKNELAGIRFFRLFFLFTMYFSGGIIPTYLLIKSLHLTGSFFVYILPGMVNVFNMILIRTYIESLPRSLEESALISGANEITVFFRILLPVCKPVLAAVLLFACVGQWNAYVDTQLYNFKNPELYPLQYILFNYLAAQTQSVEQAKRLFQVQSISPQSLKMAITVITILPIVFVYPFLQRYFISGLLIGSVKG